MAVNGRLLVFSLDWYTQKVTVCCWDGTLRPNRCLQMFTNYLLVLFVMDYGVMGPSWFTVAFLKWHRYMMIGYNDKPPERREVSDWNLAGFYVGLVRLWFQHVGMGQNWGQCVAPTQIVLLKLKPSMSGSINLMLTHTPTSQLYHSQY